MLQDHVLSKISQAEKHSSLRTILILSCHLPLYGQNVGFLSVSITIISHWFLKSLLQAARYANLILASLITPVKW